MTTAFKNIKLSVVSKNNIDKDNIVLESWYADNSKVECIIPSLSYGQEFNLVIPLKKNVKGIDLKVETETFTNKIINITDYTLTGSIYQIGYSTDIINNTVRLVFVNTVKRAINYMELRQNKKAEDLIRDLCENWETYGGKIIGNGKSSDEIYKDLSGQVFEAFNLTQQGKNEDWFNNWGKNYLPALVNSHLYMIYSNFKDPGLGVYNTGKLFSKIIDFADKIFNETKLSEPSRKNEIENSYLNSNRNTPPPSPVMRTFNSSNTSCYDGNCYTEILINDKFSKKFIKDIKKGDLVKTGKGAAKILAILKSPINAKINLISFPDKLLITEWHPIKVNGEWKFPCETETGIKVTVYSQDIYSFVLDKDHSMYINGIETVTLGHNLEGLPQHPYFGTDKVIYDIMQNIDENGIAYSSGTAKENNLVIGLKFIKEKVNKNLKDIIPNNIEREEFTKWIKENKLPLLIQKNKKTFPRFINCIARIVTVTPKSFVNYEDFMNAIKYVFNKMTYLAPEIESEGWDVLCENVLPKYLQEENDWTTKIHNRIINVE